jgi:excisionase family DNA binding protein
MDELPALLTQQQLSEYLEVSISTLERWRRTGQGPKVTWVGRSPRYARDDVLAWVKRGGSPRRG